MPMAYATRTAVSTPEQTTAKDFGILAQYALNQRALEEAKETLRQTVEENGRLTQERSDEEQETFAATELLRRELREKSATIQQLTQHNANIREDCQAEIRRVQETTSDAFRALQKEATEKQQQLHDKIAALEKDLAQVEAFRARQQEIESVVFSFQNEKKAMEEKATQERQEMERRLFEETHRLKCDHSHALEEHRIATEKEFDTRLGDRVQQILAQNRRMAIELSLHKQETTTLRREVRQLDTERQRLVEEMQFRHDMEDGYAKRGAEQGLLIKTTRARATALERSMKQLFINTAQQQRDCRRKHDRQIEDARMEVTALKKLVIANSRENKKLRGLAQEVLLQRNDVEKFLLSSIYQVRREMEHEVSGGGGGVDAVMNGMVNVEDMSWSDREKVLKILLSRIHQKNTKALTEVEAADLKGQASKEGPADPT